MPRVGADPASADFADVEGCPGNLYRLAPQGWNTHSEPSAAAVARLIRQIKKDGVRAIFIENISDLRLVEHIAREGGVRIGGTLYSDALSVPGGPAGTYLKLVEHNARALAETLTP